MKSAYFISVLLIFSCNNRYCLSSQTDEELIVEKLKDAIIIKDIKYPDTFVIGHDSMFYDKEGVLALSTKNDTVMYKNTGIGGSLGVKVIRKVEDNQFCTSWYLYFANKEFTLRKQILYNSKFEIIGVKYNHAIPSDVSKKWEEMSYGAEFPDDINKDMSLVDTLYMNKQIGSIIW